MKRLKKKKKKESPVKFISVSGFDTMGEITFRGNREHMWYSVINSHCWSVDDRSAVLTKTLDILQNVQRPTLSFKRSVSQYGGSRGHAPGSSRTNRECSNFSQQTFSSGVGNRSSLVLSVKSQMKHSRHKWAIKRLVRLHRGFVSQMPSRC